MTGENIFFEHGKHEWGRRVFVRWPEKTVMIEEVRGLVYINGLDIDYQFDTVRQAKAFIRRKMRSWND